MILIGGGLVIWLLFPLVFSAHGIFVKKRPAWVSLREGVRVTRVTLPATALLFVTVMLLSQGLDLLWNQPKETSWLVLVGLTGHAFVTSGLLAATFIYYHDADLWLQRQVQKQLLRQAG
jgi:hypothetical protein